MQIDVHVVISTAVSIYIYIYYIYKYARVCNILQPAIMNPFYPQGNFLDIGSSRKGGAGAPMKTDSGNIKTRFPITMKKDDKGG